MDRDVSQDWTGHDAHRPSGPNFGSPAPGWNPKWRLTRPQAAVILGVMMLAFSVAPILNVVRNERFNKDYDLWQETGRKVLAGGDVYPRTANLFPFMYPPACATMLAPLSALPRLWFVTALVLLNSAAWGVVIVGSVYLATGKALGRAPELYLLPSLAVIPFVHDTYLLGQPAILLLALMIGGFACLRLKRPIAAGALVAIAAAIKAYPVLAIGYFIWRRQWRAAAAMVVTLAALMCVAPAITRGPARMVEDVVLWTRGMVLKYDEESIGQRPDRAYSFKNQSVQATVHRLARPVLANGEKDRRWRVNLLSLDFKATTYLMDAAIAALGLFYVAATRLGRGSQDPPADALDQSMITLLILMVAPLSFNYSYVWLIFPLTVLAHLAGSAPAGSGLRRLTVGLIAASVGLLALAIPMLEVAQAYGSVFFSGLIPFIGIGLILRQRWYLQAAAAEPSLASPERHPATAQPA